MKPRPDRAVRAVVLQLEGRLLLAALRPSMAVATTLVPPVAFNQSLEFDGNEAPGTSQVTQVVTQEAGTATVTLSLVAYSGPLQVEVKTDPSSPAIGVNVQAVDQVVTFAVGQSQATLSVPILAGAPNPGEVDVALTATPVNPPTPIASSNSLELRILASDASIPPTITSVQGTPHSIVLTFSKPMDPTAASNVKNYSMHSSLVTSKTAVNLPGLPGLVGWALFGYHNSTSSGSVPLRAAVYDPATNSVTLIPKRKLTYLAQVTITQGSPLKKSPRPGRPTPAPLGLTDMEGNPINGDTTPGQFAVGVRSGTSQVSSTTANVLLHPSRAQQKLNRQALFANLKGTSQRT